MIKVFGLPLIISTFPNGELNMAKIEEQALEHIKNPNRPYSHIGIITFKYETDADLMTLYFLSQLPVIKSFVNTLDIAYMPYSRMDRGGYSSSDCTLRYVAQMIQSMNFKNITVCDPHSDLTLAYLGTNATAYYPFDGRIGDTASHSKVIIMFPDAGAQKRYAGMECFKPYKQIVGNKVRDFKTGKIVSYEVPEGALVKGKSVSIIDDLCSYGGTFKLAGDALRKFNPNFISLMVSHCEKSIFKGVLFNKDSPLDKIITTNSIIEVEDAINQPKLHIERIF
jgi:ribose-phosphate pyrophosphokinase